MSGKIPEYRIRYISPAANPSSAPLLQFSSSYGGGQQQRMVQFLPPSPASTIPFPAQAQGFAYPVFPQPTFLQQRQEVVRLPSSHPATAVPFPGQAQNQADKTLPPKKLIYHIQHAESLDEIRTFFPIARFNPHFPEKKLLFTAYFNAMNRIAECRNTYLTSQQVDQFIVSCLNEATTILCETFDKEPEILNNTVLKAYFRIYEIFVEKIHNPDLHQRCLAEAKKVQEKISESKRLVKNYPKMIGGIIQKTVDQKLHLKYIELAEQNVNDFCSCGGQSELIYPDFLEALARALEKTSDPKLRQKYIEKFEAVLQRSPLFLTYCAYLKTLTFLIEKTDSSEFCQNYVDMLEKVSLNVGRDLPSSVLSVQYMKALDHALEKISNPKLCEEYLNKIEKVLVALPHVDTYTQHIKVLDHIAQKTLDTEFYQELMRKIESSFNAAIGLSKFCSTPYKKHLTALSHAIEKTAHDPQLRQSFIVKAHQIYEQTVTSGFWRHDIASNYLDILSLEGNVLEAEKVFYSATSKDLGGISSYFLITYIRMADNFTKIRSAWIAAICAHAVTPSLMIECIRAAVKIGHVAEVNKMRLLDQVEYLTLSVSDRKAIFTTYKKLVLGVDIEETATAFAQKIREVGKVDFEKAKELVDFTCKKRFAGPDIYRAVFEVASLDPAHFNTIQAYFPRAHNPLAVDIPTCDQYIATMSTYLEADPQQAQKYFQEIDLANGHIQHLRSSGRG